MYKRQVHHGNDAHPLLELFQHSGDLLRRQALLITQAHRLTDEQRLSLRSRFGVYDKMCIRDSVSSGVTELLQREYQITVAGPSTMAALLNACLLYTSRCV